MAARAAPRSPDLDDRGALDRAGFADVVRFAGRAGFAALVGFAGRAGFADLVGFADHAGFADRAGFADVVGFAGRAGFGSSGGSGGGVWPSATMTSYSAWVTGCTDSRMPRRSSSMFDSAGSARIRSIATKYGRVSTYSTSTQSQIGASRVAFGSWYGLSGSNWVSSTTPVRTTRASPATPGGVAFE